MHKIRASIDSAKKNEYDTLICNRLEVLIQESNSKVIHAYLPMGSEIDISPLISKLLKNNIKVVAPKTLKNRKLQNLVLDSLEDLEEGVFGTFHPANSVEYSGNFDFIIVPGLAFDNNNFRLGYGGGYYDNFLINHPRAYKVGIFYPNQKVDKVPLEPHDVKLDEIVFFNDFL